MTNHDKAIKARHLLFRCLERLRLNTAEFSCCMDAIDRDPTGALRCYRAIWCSYTHGG